MIPHHLCTYFRSHQAKIFNPRYSSLSPLVPASQGVRWAKAAVPQRHKTKPPRASPLRPPVASPRSAKVSTRVTAQPPST